MRHESRTISKSRKNLSATPSKMRSTAKNTSESDYYYCHFNNAMYMGGIKAFQKHGRGIMIHDNGTSVVTSYFNDFRHGQNIFYKENCILSLEYHKNKIVEAVMRIPPFLLLIRYNKENQPQGKALLIDYDNRSIFYILYRRGVITQKRQQQNRSVINRIFELENLEYLIGPAHARAMKFDIEKDQNIASQIVGNKFQAGFYKKGLMNGLGFILNVKGPSVQCLQNIDSSKQEFSIKASQRGYFYNSQLNGSGQKWFKNGNYYYGDFKNGQFEGTGILKNEVKNNWVFGQFHSNNLSQLIDYSHEGDDKKLARIILSLHQKKNSWINTSIQIPQQEQYLKQIDKILISNPTQQMKNLRERKQEVLRKIQNNFMNQDHSIQENTKGGDHINYQQASRYQSNSRNPGVISRSSSQSRYTNQFKSQKPKQPRAKENQNNNFNSSQISHIQKSNKKNLKSVQMTSKQHQTKTDKSRATAAVDSRQKSPSLKQTKSTAKLQQNLLRPNQQTFALDSKRMIGKSRIFRNYDQSSEELPKFNYNEPK